MTAGAGVGVLETAKDAEVPAAEGAVLLKGCEAIAEAAIRSGVDAYFAYPITPQGCYIRYPQRWPNGQPPLPS